MFIRVNCLCVCPSSVVFIHIHIFAYCPIIHLENPDASERFPHLRSSLTFHLLLLLCRHGDLIAHAGEGEVAVVVLSHGRLEAEPPPVSLPGQQLQGLRSAWSTSDAC